MFGSWKYRRFHVSHGIGVGCAALLVGLAMAAAMRMSYEIYWWYVAGSCLILIGLLWRIRWYSFLAIGIMGIVVGLLRGSDYAYQLRQLAQYENKQVFARAIVSEDPQKPPRGGMRLVVDDVVIDTKQCAGQLWLETNDARTFRRGDRIAFHGMMKAGFGVFVLRSSNVTIDAHTPTRDPLIALRDSFSAALRRVVVEPSASLGIGFVVGQKTSLPPELEQQLRIVGLTHLVVASGYNLTILMRFAKRLFEKRSKFMVAATSVALMGGFIGISGASPSMVRAGIVAGLSLLAWYYGRVFHPLLLIMYVAAATAFLQPTYEWSDIGWWLSFLAFFGVLILSPLMVNLVYKGRKAGALMQIVVESVAAQIMTLPFIVMVFGAVPVLAVIANIASAPLIPITMLLTFIAGVFAMMTSMFSMIVALPAEIVLSYFVAVIRFLSQPSWAQMTVTVAWQFMVFLYVIIMGVVVLLWRMTRHNFRTQSLID